jgi:hypothetical protein
VPSFSAAEQRHEIAQGNALIFRQAHHLLPTTLDKGIPTKVMALIAILSTLLLFGAAIAGHTSLQTPIVGFTQSSYAVREDDGEVLIPVSINQLPVAGEVVRVEFYTVPGTAGEGNDYLPTSTILRFTQWSDTLQFGYVTIKNDNVFGEENETIELVLRLLTPETGQLGNDVATLIIVEDDLPSSKAKAYVQPVFAEVVPPTSTPIPITKTPPPPPAH